MASFFQTGSKIGVTLGNSDGATAKFTLGDRVSGSAESEWVYVRANVALTTGKVVQLSSNFSAALCPPAYSGKELAFAQGTFAASDYGWVAKRGNGIYVRITAAATAGKQLYLVATGASTGVLRRTAATGTLAGVTLVSTNTAAVQRALLAYVNWPHILNF